MEVGRVGDGSCRRKREHSAPPAGRRSAVSMAEPKNLSTKELTMPPVGRQSAVRIARPKKLLDTAGLLMEVARHPLSVAAVARIK